MWKSLLTLETVLLFLLIAAGLSENDFLFNSAFVAWPCAFVQLFNQNRYVLSKESLHRMGMIHSPITEFKSYFPHISAVVLFYGPGKIIDGEHEKCIYTEANGNTKHQ